MNRIIYAGKHLLTYSVSRHNHSSWELIYCTGGEGKMVFETKVFPYQANDMLIIPPTVVHQNESEHGFTNIHINLVEPRWQLNEPTMIREDGTHFMLDALEAIFYLFSSSAKQNGMLLNAYGDLIVSLVETRLETPQYSPVVEEIRQSIIRNYPSEDFSLEAYLHALPFNYDYLRKLFKTEMGLTPHQFLSEIRLQTAAEHLSFPDKDAISISEVAHLCGFQEPLYFTRMFKKKYGVSPTEYQKEQRKSAQTHAGSVKNYL